MPTKPSLRVAALCVWTVFWFAFTPAFGALQTENWQTSDSFLDSDVMSGDEAFTEPIDEIKVAVAEAGIVKKLLVHRGDPVVPNQLLMELDTSVLTATRQIALSKAKNLARFNAAKVEYKIKNERYDKLVRLQRDGAGSPEEVERALGDVAVAEQNIEAIREEAEQFLLEVAKFDAQIEQLRIRSPIHGQVVEVKKNVGEHVSSADPHIFTVVRFDKLRAVFHIPTSKVIKIQEGDILPVLLTETDQKANAEVEFVAPITRADSGRVRVDVLIDNQANQFRSGVRCRLLNGVIKTSSRTPRRR